MAFLERFPFKDNFSFCEISYNELFEEYLAEAKKQADKLGKWSKVAKPIDEDELGVLGRIAKLAGTSPSEKFVITHLGDAALFVATDVGELVKNSIARQIGERLKPPGFDPSTDSWSVIAHSLGARVMTEVLQAGFSAQPSLASFGKARLVMMIANTSRLLEKFSPINAGDVYHNVVFPALDPSLGACEHYLTVTHRFDPIAFVEEFDPPATFGDGRTLIDEVYHTVKLSLNDITSKEIHDLEHYLRHPEVHATMFRYLLPGSGKRGATPAEMQEQMRIYGEEALSAKVTNVWRDALSDLKNRKTEKIKEIFALWEEYGDLIS